MSRRQPMGCRSIVIQTMNYINKDYINEKTLYLPKNNKNYCDKKEIDFLSKEELNDKSFMLQFFKNHSSSIWLDFTKVSDFLLNDKDFILQVFNIDPSSSYSIYQGLPKYLQENRDIAFFTIKNSDENDMIVYLYAKELLFDKEITLYRIKNKKNPFEVYKSIPDENFVKNFDILYFTFENIIKRNIKNKKKLVACSEPNFFLRCYMNSYDDVDDMINIMPKNLKEKYNETKNIDDFLDYLKCIPNFLEKNKKFNYDDSFKTIIFFLYDKSFYN